MSSAPAVVGVVMGSSSDWETLRTRSRFSHEFGIAHEARVVSAHRMPDEHVRLRRRRRRRAACRRSSPAPAAPPTCRACSPPRPPCRCSACRWRAGTCRASIRCYSHRADAEGIPVATFAIGSAGAANAALFAVAMLASGDAALRDAARRLPRPPDRRRAGDDGRAEVSPAAQRRPARAAARAAAFIAPGATLGVLGGGQLGRMFVHAAQQAGLPHRGARPRRDQPGRPRRATTTCAADYLDADGLARLADVAAARHHRIRERAGRGAGARWRSAGRWRRAPTRSRSARTGRAEKAHSRARRRLRAVRGDRTRRPSSAASPTRCCPAS